MKIKSPDTAGLYDDKGRMLSRCMQHKFPSSKMFVNFLKEHLSLPGEAVVTHDYDVETGKIKINVTIESRVPPGIKIGGFGGKMSVRKRPL